VLGIFSNGKGINTFLLTPSSTCFGVAIKELEQCNNISPNGLTLALSSPTRHPRNSLSMNCKPSRVSTKCFEYAAHDKWSPAPEAFPLLLADYSPFNLHVSKLLTSYISQDSEHRATVGSSSPGRQPSSLTSA